MLDKDSLKFRYHYVVVVVCIVSTSGYEEKVSITTNNFLPFRNGPQKFAFSVCQD